MEPILRLLDEAGAVPVEPPEPHAIGVERYGRQFRMPAISLGWFPDRTPGEDFVRVSIAGFDHATELCLLRAGESLSVHATAFWDFAKALFPEAPEF
jgi:hypothetical protein